MNTVDKVKACGTVQEALLVLAAAIDEALAAPKFVDFDQPLTWDETPGTIVVNEPADNRARIEGDDVIVNPVSEERQNARYTFAYAARLPEYYGPALSEEAFLDAYVKGGPRWLYYTNRACVMQMPMELRRELVADVLLDSPSEAAEIGADILKFDESMPEGAQLEAQRDRRNVGPA